MGNKKPVVRTELAKVNGEMEGSEKEESRFHPSVWIHPSAVIDEGVKIGEGSKIWHFTHIGDHAKIGRNVSIGDYVYIGPEVEIGDGCKIQNHVSIFEGVVLEEKVFVGPGVVFTNVKNPRAFINRRYAFKHTGVGLGVTIGANATILCGLSIGRFAFIGAGALVTRNVDAFSLELGVPSEHVSWMNEEGNQQLNRPGL